MAFYADGSDDLILGPDISVSSTSTNADFNITYLVSTLHLRRMRL